MLIVLLADIHSNLEALCSVQEAVKKIAPDKVICLGDIVGYGACPQECIDIVKANNWQVIAGNHDWAVSGKIGIDSFNPYAKEAVIWTKDRLTADYKVYLKNLPLISGYDGLTAIHASLYKPEEFKYLDNYFAVNRDFSLLNQINKQTLFAAHTHIPSVFIRKGASLYKDYSQTIELKDKFKYIINVGSVGQPRDRNPAGCICVYDTGKNTLNFVRVKYDIKKTQKSIIKAGLPEILANRLKSGW